MKGRADEGWFLLRSSRDMAILAGLYLAVVCAPVAAQSGSERDVSETVSPVGVQSGDEIGPDAADLMKLMSVAMSSLNYEGSFVHAQGTSLSVISVVHASYPEGEFERLVSLDGEAREVIRTDTLVTCIWPASESVIMTKSQPRDLLPQIEVDFSDHHSRYEFTLTGRGRVAGRDTYIVDVIPRDIFRYGYRFWIDEETHLMLRSMLLDGPDQPVEQIMFTSIDFLDSVDKARFDYQAAEEQGGQWVTWLREKKDQAAAILKDQTFGGPDQISFSTLPPGYSKLSENYVSLSKNQEPQSHIMLSDGIASVSVYVDYLPTADHADALVGLSRMGAMSAYGYRTDAAVITVVGAVPEATVKAIGAAVVINQ